MKIEKLTENKIRIVLNSEDFKAKDIDLHSIMSKTESSHGLFLEILNKAQKQVGFDTEGHKLLIEAFSSYDGVFVFTITKYLEKETKSKKSDLYSKTRLTVKRKMANINTSCVTYSFEDFEEFCDFCHFLQNHNSINISKIAKNISLYLYNETYYLMLKEVNSDNANVQKLYFLLSEFAKLIGHSENFINKLLEHGTAIFPKNALANGMKYFSK